MVRNSDRVQEIKAADPAFAAKAETVQGIAVGVAAVAVGGAAIAGVGAATAATGEAATTATGAGVATAAIAGEKAVEKVLTKEAAKGIRSLEKRIAEHQSKLADFKANPTVRPGMEGQPPEVIKAAQQSRIAHLEREIQTFKDNIQKLLLGD